MLNTKNICPHFLSEPRCGGCTYWNLDYSTEIDSKKENLKSKLNLNPVNIRVKKTPEKFSLRTRFDFTFIQVQGRFKIGLYSQITHELVDISDCWVLHPELQKAFTVFRSRLAILPLTIQKGSVRLRISENLKKWGVWLDLANQDIKTLLVEKTFLQQLSQNFIVEIGQKKKRLKTEMLDNDQYKLMDPQPEFWFKTHGYPLLCAISSFTQPTWETADLITEQILTWLEYAQPEHIVEFGSGIGQYTVPLIHKDYKITIYESDVFALNCLQLNIKDEYKNNLQIATHQDDTQFNETSLALVNPPRSGLQNFKLKLNNPLIKNIIYISCFPDSLAEDLKYLEDFYLIKDIVLVDQFKRTSHYEVAVFLEKK